MIGTFGIETNVFLSRLLPKANLRLSPLPGPLDPGYVEPPSLEGLNMIKDEKAFYVTRFLPEPSKKATIHSLVPKGPGTKGKIKPPYLSRLGFVSFIAS